MAELSESSSQSDSLDNRAIKWEGLQRAIYFAHVVADYRKNQNGGRRMNIDREIVIKLRALERMTQEQFADMIGVHHSMISGIERNRRDVSRSLAIRIVAAFGLTPERIQELRELPA